MSKDNQIQLMLTSVVGPVLSHRGQAETGVAQPGVNPWWSQGLLPVRNAVKTRRSVAWMCDLSAILQKRVSVNSELFRGLNRERVVQRVRVFAPVGWLSRG